MANKWIVRVTNNSGSTVELKDLGIKIADGVTKTLSEFFKFDILSTSADLKAAISSGTLQVNDGTDDLSVDDGIELVFLENRYNTEEIYVKKADLTEFDHSASLNRNIPYQHPISAITSLQDELDLKASIEYVDFELLTHIDDFHALSAIHTADVVALSGEIDNVYMDLLDHIDDTSNPHEVTQTQVGLGNVDNTSDLNKPISTATQNALDFKADITYVDDLSANEILEYWFESFDSVNTTTWESLSGNNIILQGTGGSNSIVSGEYNIIGGLNNIIDGSRSSIMGGGYPVVGMGNEVHANESLIVGGGDNKIHYGDDSVIVGGWNNSMNTNADIAFIGGGTSNSTHGTASFIGGGDTNTVGASGTTIQHGNYSLIVGGQQNKIIDSRYSSIVGGSNNTNQSIYGFIGGGENNYAMGYDGEGGAYYQVLCGGSDNITHNDYSVIVGGYNNTNYSFEGGIVCGHANTMGLSATLPHSSFVGAGYLNKIASDISYIYSSHYSSIVGGYSNSIDGQECFIGGGEKNTISIDLNNYYKYSSIVGGELNKVYGPWGFIGGGRDNTILPGGYYNFIGGGEKNSLNVSVDGAGYSAIVAGRFNSVTGNNVFIGGGSWNKILDTSAYSFVGGGGGANDGNGNEITGNYSSIVGGFDSTVTGDYSSIGGGNTNTTSASNTTIAGGYHNSIASGSTSSTIAGGSWNKILDTSAYSFVGGGGGANDGNGNEITGNYSSIVGGFDNIITSDYSFVGGGSNNNINIGSDYAVSSGYYSFVSTYGAQNHAAGRFSSNGDAQIGRYVLRNLITSDTKTHLYPNGETDGIFVNDYQTMSFVGTVTARTSGAIPDVASWKIEGVVSKNGTLESDLVVHDYTITTIYNPTTWTIDISKVGATEYFSVGVTATGWTKNIRVVAELSTSEVIFA